ncbi:MAG: hypothetical protein WEE36_08730 [Acidimicrobiia bacterium]
MTQRASDRVEKIAADLAAVFYAATLTADPTLDPRAFPPDLADYRATGKRLALALVAPSHRAVIRCVARSRQSRPDLTSRALAVVHNRELLIIQDRRGSTPMGYRLLESRLVDLPMASRERQTRLRLACPYCRSRHDLPFHFLHRAREDEVSHPIGPLPFDDSDQASLRYQAFAETTGHFDGHGSLFVRSTPWRIELYREHFGILPPHDTHRLRLLGERTFPYALGATGPNREVRWFDSDTVAVGALRVAEAHQ